MQSFHSRAGKAYLFSAVVNMVSAAKEQRLMTTGLHTVCDLHCNGCMQVVGWSYVRPHATVLCKFACLLHLPVWQQATDTFIRFFGIELQANVTPDFMTMMQIWAEEASQKYKEGKSIIERSKVVFSKHEEESIEYCPISPISFADMSLDSELDEEGC